MKKKYLFVLLLLFITGCHTKTYTVTFNTDGGTKLSNKDIKEGGNIKNIDLPTKEGYIFVSWEKDGVEYDPNTPIKEDITLKAIWIKTPELTKNYTVSFNIDGEIKTKTIKEGDKVAKPNNPEKINYHFIGWYIGDELYTFEEPIVKDIVLIAKFEKQVLTITYELNGGSGLAKTAIKKGTTIKSPETPTKFGYAFKEWQHNGKTFDFSKPVNEDITLTAIWEPIKYVKVTFDTDGGSMVKNQMIESGNTIKTPEVPKKEGYIFKYWSTGDGEFDLTQKITKDITLIAIYEKIESQSQENENKEQEE